jgi:WD40 repeat protein
MKFPATATLRLWDLTLAKAKGDPIKAHNGRVATVNIGRIGGRPVAVSGGDDGTVKLWDIGSRQPVGVLRRRHDGAVNTAVIGDCFGDPVVVSAGSDGMIHCSDLAEGRASSARVLGLKTLV